MQRMQFRAKSAKNDLEPTDLIKCNFFLEMEGVFLMIRFCIGQLGSPAFFFTMWAFWCCPFDYVWWSIGTFGFCSKITLFFVI
jgi:hypothetical protein